MIQTLFKNISVLVAILTIPPLNQASPPLLPQVKCSLQDTVCLTTQVGILIKDFVKGSPELGIEKQDKLSTNSIEIKENGLIYEMKNVEVEGLKNAVIDNVSVDMEYKTIRLSLQTSFIITSDYKADGVLYAIPVLGDGRATIKINNVALEMLMIFDIIQNKDGKDIMNLTGYTFGYDVLGDGHYHYENAFNNDKKKSEKFHSFVNEYWRTMIANFGKYMIQAITNKIYNAIKIYLGSNNLEDLAT